MGTIINTVAVIFGGLLGLLLKKGIAHRFEKILMQALGLSTIFIGVSGVLKYMLMMENGSLTTRGTMLLIFSLVIGSLLGEWLNIEAFTEKLGVRLRDAVKLKNDNRFVDGFVTSSLIICVGAMAIVGAMEDGLSGSISTLVAKSLLDFVLVTIMAAAYGVGVVFSALPIFVYQGAITLIAMLFGSVISERLIGELSFVGNALVFCVGVNLVKEKTFRVANMLPALLIPVFVEIYRVIF